MRTNTDLSARILSFIRAYQLGHDNSPSVREIQQALNISSTSVVDYNLKKLAREGFIKHTPKRSRSIRLAKSDPRTAAQKLIREFNEAELALVFIALEQHLYPEGVRP